MMAKSAKTLTAEIKRMIYNSTQLSFEQIELLCYAAIERSLFAMGTLH
jgi:hypothetical protein